MIFRHTLPPIRLARKLIALPLILLLAAPAIAADDPQMQYPLAVAATKDGTVFVADLHLPGIWRIKDGQLALEYRASKRFGTPLNRVRCLAIDNKERLLAGDSATREVYRFEDGKPVPLTHGMIGIPVVLAVRADGRIFVSDLETQRIWSFPSKGLAADERPEEVAVIAGVRGLAFDAKGRLLVATTRENPIRRIDDKGNVEILLKGRPFQFPHQIAVAKDGTIYVTDNYASALWKFSPGEAKKDGANPTPLHQGKPFDKPVGLTWLGDDLLVADPHAKQIFRVTLDGKVTPLMAGNDN